MKIVITGGKGMLGRTLQRVLSEHELIIADLPEWDITDADGFDSNLRSTAPDAVIHCAAMTAVDKCESEPDLAYKLNAVGSMNVAAACHRNAVKLIAISTDYVFGGELDRPYHEFDVAGGAHTVYGASKFAGEEMIRRHCPNHLICRISWLYFCPLNARSCRRHTPCSQGRRRPAWQPDIHFGRRQKTRRIATASEACRNLPSDMRRRGDMGRVRRGDFPPFWHSAADTAMHDRRVPTARKTPPKLAPRKAHASPLRLTAYARLA